MLERDESRMCTVGNGTETEIVVVTGWGCRLMKGSQGLDSNSGAYWGGTSPWLANPDLKRDTRVSVWQIRIVSSPLKIDEHLETSEYLALWLVETFPVEIGRRHRSC